MKNSIKISIFMIMLALLLVGCANDNNDQTRNNDMGMNTEPIGFTGESTDQTNQQTAREPRFPINPGREQNIFTPEPKREIAQGDQGIRTNPEETEKDESTNQTASGFQQEVAKLTNQEREKNGLSPLQIDTALQEVAQTKSEDMATNNYFSHTSPTYGSPFDMLQQFEVDYTTAAENIASGQQSPKEVVNGWMNSPGHRKNIMNEKVTHIGVGYAEDGAYWTQLFIAK
ncbi:hypothetical protein GCM10011351_29900 [Paraliobacillus quinghaiensis]|uniref:SCP domain-containing protein n=1 Tax=Paraliobacillus quinghaiensis TaxID=470815 RepID=A0A917TWP8_9BACI|nr:CAP domain-containing protein [Paraliobacillus quinghaiensis]GGM41802.1 hypothetical protein GCM10011351_29900 [Paraliobacillus quinghaiensis]